MARQAAGICGLMVLERSTFAGTSGLWLVDWLVHPGEGPPNIALFGAWNARARALEDLAVTTLPTTFPLFVDFQRWGLRVHPSEWILAAQLFGERQDMQMLRNTWFYTRGDVLT